MKTKVLVVGIIFALILVAGCADLPQPPTYKKTCTTDSGNITGKAMIPDPSGWGGTRYTITLDYNATYQTSPENFAKAKVGGYMTTEMCWNELVK